MTLKSTNVVWHLSAPILYRKPVTAEYRIAALEAQLAKILRLLRETSSRLEDHKEDIGAVAHAVNRLEGHPVALSESMVSPKKAHDTK